VAPYCLQHNFNLFALFSHSRIFLIASNIIALALSNGLGVVYQCEGNLHSNLMIEILEYIVVELFGVVDCDVSWNTVAANDVLSEKFLSGCGAYICNGLRLNPFCEILYYYDGKGVVALSWS
jgi:hypothetical protein